MAAKESENVMSNPAQRILDAVQGDNTTIVALANAVAKNDLDAVSRLLESRGVSLSRDELEGVIRGGGQVGMAITCTCTCT